MLTIPRLKKRSDFLRVASCQRKVVTSTMIVQFAKRSLMGKNNPIHEAPLRVGFTASRKVGNAVKRNRARRRLRAVTQVICPLFSFAGEDLVLIARPAAVTTPFPTLLENFQYALTRLEVPLS